MESQADSIFANAATIEKYDAELWEALNKESNRQEEHIELIASENYASQRVMEAQGGILTNKYAEGYPSKRYYGGCEYVDLAEELAIGRAKELFKADYANVQPHSGSSANAAAFLAMLEPNDTILGMSLDHGGHLTHGAKVNFSGKNYTAFQYGLHPDTHDINYDQVRDLAKTADSIKVKYKDLPLDLLNIYANSEIREGKFLEDAEGSYKGFMNWMKGRMEKEIAKRKSKTGKERITEAFKKKLADIKSRQKDIINLFKISKLLSQAKQIFVNKYNNAVYNTKHFLDNGDGTLTASNPEGYVAVGREGDAVKLVDRLEFSRANFSGGQTSTPITK